MDWHDDGDDGDGDDDGSGWLGWVDGGVGSSGGGGHRDDENGDDGLEQRRAVDGLDLLLAPLEPRPGLGLLLGILGYFLQLRGDFLALLLRICVKVICSAGIVTFRNGLDLNY